MNIKAYVWDDEYHGESHVVWAATPGKAKALLAAEHDRELLSHGWWLYCSNCGTQVYDDEATVLTEETVLCAECAKDWSEEK